MLNSYYFALCGSNLIILADDVVRRRGYSDHFVTKFVCMCVWVCMLAR